MTKKRPTGVTVFAILNLVFGGLGLVGGLCGIGFQIANQAVHSMQAKNQPPAAGPAPVNPMDVQNRLTEKIPYYRAVEVGGAVVHLILSGIMVFAGIALLRMSAVGRWTCIGYGLLRIPIALAEAVWTILVVSPVVQEVMTEAMKEAAKGAKGAEMPPGFGGIMGGVVSVFTGLGALIVVSYSAAMLIYMLMPSTAKAFAAPAPVEGAEPAAAGQEYDDPDFRRERRESPPDF